MELGRQQSTWCEETAAVLAGSARQSRRLLRAWVRTAAPRLEGALGARDVAVLGVVRGALLDGGMVEQILVEHLLQRHRRLRTGSEVPDAVSVFRPAALRLGQRLYRPNPVHLLDIAVDIAVVEPLVAQELLQHVHRLPAKVAVDGEVRSATPLEEPLQRLNRVRPEHAVLGNTSAKAVVVEVVNKRLEGDVPLCELRFVRF
eukprot:7386445-Prymnesium_polylepis.2